MFIVESLDEYEKRQKLRYGIFNCYYNCWNCISFSLIALIPDAQGHGVQAQLQSRFVRINNEAFSAQSVHTGDTIVVTGELQSLVNRPSERMAITFQ